jgi:hypothetical protein
MALDGVGFSKYALGMYDQGRERAIEIAERARQEQERARMQQMQDAARQRNEGIFSKFGAYGPAPQPAMPQQAPQAQMMGAQPKPVQQGPGRFSSIMQSATQQYGLPAGYLERTAQIESGMNPNAKNPKSTAKGLFQFLDRTAQEYGLANPMDPNASTDAAARLAQKNMRALKAVLGRDPTPGELYLAHQQGTQGAIRLLRNPNAPAMQVVGRQALMLNGGDPNMTAGQFASKWTGKFGQGQQPQGVQMASAGGAMPMQMQQQAQAPMAQAPMQQPQAQQMPGSEIPTQDLIAVYRDPGSSEEDRAIAKMLLETRFAAQRQPNQGRPELGMTPIWGQDAQGNPVLLQLGQGQLVTAQAPDGIRLTPGVQMLNTGTGFTGVNTKTGQPIGTPIPIDVGGKAAQEFTGKDTAERIAAAPAYIRKAQEATAVIDGILNDPAFEYGTGAAGTLLRRIPGTPTRRFGTRVEQLQGQAFLQAFESLRGGGAITQIEGTKATDAIARLDASQSPEDYRAALNELKGILATAIQREQARMGGQQPAPAPAPAAAQGPATNTGQTQTGTKWRVVQ